MLTRKEERERIDEINEAIRNKGANWVAGETSVSNLEDYEMRQLCGVIPERVPDYKRVAPSVYVKTPHDFSWRSKDGSDWTTSIKDQGSCGSCWAFGFLGALESQLNIKAGVPNMDKDLSEQYMLSCSEGGCNGYTMSGTANWLKMPTFKPDSASGGAPEDCFDYKANDDIPCSDACDEHLDILSYIRDWNWVERDVESVKNFVINGPLPAAMLVYEDFFSYSSGVYEHVSGDLKNGHCVTIVGWNDGDENTPGHWICKNSWGTGWGLDGWFKIKYNECEIERYVPQFTDVGSMFGSIRCTSNPDDVEIYIDGKSVGERTPYTVDNVASYIMNVTFKKDGYADCSKKVKVSPNETIECHCNMERGGTPTPSPSPTPSPTPRPSIIVCLLPRAAGGERTPRVQTKELAPRVACLRKR